MASRTHTAARKSIEAENVCESKRIDEIVTRLSQKDHRDVALIDLMTVAEHLVGSMQTIFSELDSSIYREFDNISGSISRARGEILELQPHDISEDHIPEADRELQAIVTATEHATHDIMEAAETVLALEAQDLASYKAAVEAEVMKIFEACSFQDITGQRVGKVVETLEDIDDRVNRISAAFGSPKGNAVQSARQKARDARKRDLILNGPALEGQGVGQDDVDQILSGDQSAIDALFD